MRKVEQNLVACAFILRSDIIAFAAHFFGALVSRGIAEEYAVAAKERRRMDDFIIDIATKG